MTADPIPPKFLSLEFHARFFPRLLRDRVLRRGKETQGTSFTSTMEMMIGMAVCLTLAALGIPPAVDRGSIAGWLAAVAGIGGVLALLVSSVAAQWGTRSSYDNFLIGVFFFFLSLGIFIGIPVGMDSHSFPLGVSASLAGLAGGYAIGIRAALGLQYLGWMAGIVNMLAGFGAIVIGGAALVVSLLPLIGR